jgi:glutamyl-tRNA reductase
MRMEILIIGLNHLSAPVEIRERITFPGDQDGGLARQITRVEGVEEAVVLSTCNRGEILVATGDPERSPAGLVSLIGEIHGLEPAIFQDHLYLKKGSEAVRHLFRVASSLDSMVLGEPQILGQVKEGYRRATRGNATGPILNRLMHRAFFTAKRVRHETGVGRAAVSVAYVAVELARKILGNLSTKRILLIGAGEMAELAARHLHTQVQRPLVVTNRTYETACALAGELRGTALPMEKLEEGLVEADVVITSTASCEPIIKIDHFKTVMRRRRFRPIVLIDIAIPRDVEPEVNDIDGVYLYNIDDLKAAVDDNLGERREEAIKAEKIVAEEVAKFINWTRTLDAAPIIVALKEKLEQIRRSELARLNGKLAGLGQADREAVEIITRSMVNKIAHDPIVFLKKTGSTGKRNFYLEVAQRLFNLDEPPTDAFTGNEEPSEK